MPSTVERVALVTQEFRWDEKSSSLVLSARPGAEERESTSYCSTAPGASALGSSLLALFSGQGQLVEVPVNPLPPGLSFERRTPTVRLVYPPLSVDREMVVVGFNSEMNPDGTEKGTLLLW